LRHARLWRDDLPRCLLRWAGNLLAMTDSPAPSLTLLIKLLKMTTSSHEAEALVAVRKANAELTKFGGDWEALLRGKVTVIGDPFADLQKPDRGRTSAPKPTPPPQPQPPPRPHTPPQQPRRAKAASPHAPSGGFTRPGPAPQPQTAKPQKPPAWSNAPKPGTITLEDII
jgi:hypothetical protein